MSTPIKRKLAAILSADVAGYSRLMGEDEEGTLRLLAAHRAVVDSIIALHDGRVVNTAGDSVLAEFTSPVEAVRAASEIQEALKTRNDSLPEPRRMRFRIGVNLGDVMVKGDDLLGDGVNVAARLQTLAEPGGICISGSVFDQIEGKLSLRFQDMGEQALKNISRPVRALHLRGPAPQASAQPRRRRGAAAALAGAGLVALAGGAYLAGLIPHTAPGDGRHEAAAWQSVMSSSDIAALERYLADHPAGVHAGEARARIAGLLAGARQTVEAERGATERARAEADLARLKAETEAARLKAEAESAKEGAEMERKKAEEERAAAARARADSEAAKPAGEPARPAAARPRTAALAPPGTRESRFDGVWVGELSCPDWRGGAGFRRRQRGVVRSGEMTIEMAVPGRPRPIRSVGKVRDDDSVELRGQGIGPAGKAFEHVVKGRFSDDGFTGQAEPPARPCSFQLSREPAPPRPGG